MIELIQANALRIPLADESVQVCVTSPPYFGRHKPFMINTLIASREAKP